MALFEKNSAAEQAHEFKSSVMRLMLIWFGFGHIPIFLTLLASIYPAPHTIYLFTHLNNPTDWVLIKGISAVIILFLGLLISRRLQTEQEQKRPSFILVIFGYVSLLLIGNYAIYAIMNDLAIPNTAGGARALVTTMWWAAIAIYMLVISSMRGVRYRSEKLLGMILLAITVAKILLYDIVTMGIQFKIIILIAIGALLLLFSYLAHTKGWLRDKES
jgi:hypothetical protein